MKVKSFIAGFGNGTDAALACLDKKVNELNADKIHQIADTLYLRGLANNGNPDLVRVVVYEKK